MTTLHYIYDPLCGWCYGAKPLVQAARSVLPVIAHGGGMMTGANRQQVSPQLRNYVMPHDRRIAEYSGQPFGEAYFEGLLRDHSAVFDSAPPTAAILAAEELGGHGLELLGRLQTAHYVEGRRIADEAVLLELAQSIGLPAQAFLAALRAVDVQGAYQGQSYLAGPGRRPGFPDLCPGAGRPVHADRHRPLARQTRGIRPMADASLAGAGLYAIVGLRSGWLFVLIDS